MYYELALYSLEPLWPFLFCIRIKNFEGAHTGQTFLEISNGRKTVRMAPILTIFGSNESQRCQLNFAKFSRCRKNFREDENFKKLSRKVRKSLPRVRFLTKNKLEMAKYHYYLLYDEQVRAYKCRT